ncbi:MAG: glutamate--tRNA ligase [Bacteroidetes bacterium HGW-Bacteroidetes-21]|jgi:glutamyl-tRNA synthetase|nr:MAG: glutamate--tRNA ligase [Bacteroidetes bacterium HGW-Bacteroidetes-21]
MEKTVRVRFAPSPTGPLHIGGVRTALFNYLFAKKHQGKCILRIEDTDQTRFVPGAEKYIIDSLAWCGISFDEDVVKGGPFGPYRQSERKAMYKTFADELLAKGHAYFAFDTPEELDAIRKQYELEKKTFQYDVHTRLNLKNSLTMSEGEVGELLKNNTHFVIRFRMPENFDIVMQDIIRGEIHVNSSTLDDKVLFKSDGMPTYHLANIVDDHLMEISHVIRGEEWLPSLPLHYMLYNSFGWDKPEFAHLPLILKPDGKGKLSKRDGDKGGFPVFPCNWTTDEGEIYPGYRESGYYPDAFVNMLVLLGWNPGGEREIFNIDELSEIFSLERAGKAGARFDPDKAKWFNQQYLRQKSDKEVAEELLPYLTDVSIPMEMLSKICAMGRERVYFVHEIPQDMPFFFKPLTTYCDVTLKKKWKEETPQVIEAVKAVIAGMADFTRENIETQIKQYIETNSLGFGQVMPGLRLVITGQGQGPDLFSVMEILGKEESLARITKSLEAIKNL